MVCKTGFLWKEGERITEETARSGTEEEGIVEQEKAAIDAEIEAIDNELNRFDRETLNSGIFGIFGSLFQNREKQLEGFPVSSLPDEIRSYVTNVAESLQVPVDMVASFVLSIISLCLQGKFRIMVKPDWYETINLYTLVIARPSERKSPALKEVAAPVHKYVKEENERRHPEIVKYELERKVLSGKLKNIQDSLSKSGSKTKYTIQDALECQRELDNLEEVKKLQMILDDVTPEALVKAMKENNERIGIVSAEGGIFGMLAGRYSNNTNIDIFLKGYSGEYYSAVRIGREGIELGNPLLTITLAVQPQVVVDIMDNKDFRGRGLLARFLYFIPNTRVGSRIYKSKPINPFVKEQYEKLINELLKITDMTEFLDRVIKLSPEADTLSEAYNQWIEHQLVNELEEIEDWAGNLHGNTMRIAAINIGKYYLEHSKQAFDIMGVSESQDIRDAKYIISRIDSNTKNPKNTKNMTKRDLWHLCKGHFKSVEEMEPGLEVLKEHGYIAIVTEKSGNRGRPSERIYINPEYIKWKEEQK